MLLSGQEGNVLVIYLEVYAPDCAFKVQHTNTVLTVIFTEINVKSSSRNHRDKCIGMYRSLDPFKVNVQ